MEIIVNIYIKVVYSDFIPAKSYFKGNSNIISINLNLSNNCCLYSLENKYVIQVKLL